MPELPDIIVYIDALEPRIVGHRLERIEIAGPFLLRTAVPPIESAENRKVVALRRVGKRIAIGLEVDPARDADRAPFWLVLHLMIAGRLHWSERRVTPDGRRTLAAFHFDSGTLTLTEAGAKKRASLHLISGEEELNKIDRGGIDVLSAALDEFSKV